MPSFSTPSPIDLAINLQVGFVEVVASDRDDTVVTVVPTNPGKAVDRRGADETAVDFDGQRLTVIGPKPRLSWIGPTESIDLRVELPTGSRLTAELPVGNVRTSGRLGATRIKASTGAVDLEATGDLWLRASHGNVTAGIVDGAAEVTADHGQIRIDSIAADAVLRASHGSIAVGETGGDVEAKLSYGDLEIGSALGSVTANTAYGTVRIREASSGSLQLESGYGQIDVGIRAGVPAWLDLSSKEGRVRNELDGEGAPAETEQSVAVRARTQFGPVTVHRAR
ncbi:hypothetical protein M2152_001976 [Microbacteriaceae bacterium SG_E_30_P1]|uniref:DUF4097 domain-containing protein n=1 Tax=Antiquaquibacter oligotrophicus TaxID=2880260 RepID=A0ABT6KRG0_9MICO|nr:DUF4097 family beta strand repeat-containing protein [Antiquaquibacter oligotrophicus]MDH6181794.1 hypothetical protein [Antiquaquibacter oligotrophicus]UDF12526.1 DUF4097 domain-containing protein [Antiquaquibacter oligotrophicus]